jgi:hypothetical protein
MGGSRTENLGFTEIVFGGEGEGGRGIGEMGARIVNIDIIKSKVIKFMMHYRDPQA